MKELITIQSKLKAPKNQYNKFGGFKYRNCEDILEAAKPILAENGCYLTISDEIIEVGGRIYVKATASLRNSDGASITVSASAREEDTKKGMDASQITGAASSYARKYALNGLFCIDDTKDADTMENSELDKAIQEINKAKTKAELLSIWNKYTSLQQNKEFTSASTNRKKCI
ncbi:MAG: ERF family protein [Phocaeicola sp.]